MSRDDASFAALTRKISETAGLTLDAYKSKCMRRRIAVRMRAVGAHTYEDYLSVLDRAPDELDRLLDALTINVTKFYRNRETWDRVSEVIAPALLARREGRVRIWSAGCASGEESYTLAMLFAEAAQRAGQQGWVERFVIDATDIDRLSLERARTGRYPAVAFSETPATIVGRYCRTAGPETYLVEERVRERVLVRRHDLTRDPAPRPPYDLIVCRNVIIYFDRPTQERLLLLFHDALEAGGFLVLGKVETIFGPARTKFDLVEPRDRIYRRPV